MTAVQRRVRGVDSCGLNTPTRRRYADAEREWVQRSLRNVIEYRSSATGGM
jgi:hypothetical protein